MTAVMCGSASSSTTSVTVSQQQEALMSPSSSAQPQHNSAAAAAAAEQQQQQQQQQSESLQPAQAQLTSSAQLQQRVAALQQSVGNLAQLDLQGLAALLPPGTSIEQLQNIKQKLVQLNQIQQQQMQHRKLERSASEPHAHDRDLNSEAALSSVNSSRYKTELCRPFEENGTCKYGDKCQFAHGLDELRSLTRHPKYKTELCRTFHTTGLCPYGPRCHFIHNADEAKKPTNGTSLTGVSSASSQEALNMKLLASSQSAPQQIPLTTANSISSTSSCSISPFEQSPLAPLAQQQQQQHKMLGQLMRTQHSNGLGARSVSQYQCDHLPNMASGAALMKSRMHALRPKALSIGCMSLGSTGDLSPPISPSMYDDPFTPSYLNNSNSTTTITTSSRMSNFFTTSANSSSSSSASPNISSADISMYHSPSPPSLSTSPLAGNPSSLNATEISAMIANAGHSPVAGGLLTPTSAMVLPTTTTSASLGSSSCGSSASGYASMSSSGQQLHLQASSGLVNSMMRPAIIHHRHGQQQQLSFSATFGDQLMSAPAVISSSPIFEFPAISAAAVAGSTNALNEHRRAFRTLTPPSPLESLGSDFADSLLSTVGQAAALVGSQGAHMGGLFVNKQTENSSACRLPVFDQLARSMGAR